MIRVWFEQTVNIGISIALTIYFIADTSARP